MRCPLARCATPLIVGLAMVGCGNAETASTRTAASTTAIASTAATAPPATAVVVPPDPDATIGPLTPVDVTEPCPISDPSAAGPEMVDEATRLEPMLGQVLAYGQARPDVWGTYGLVWQGAGDASVFVSFTSDIESHREALTTQVAFPDELIVCQSPVNGAQAQTLQAQLARELAGRFEFVGVGSGGAVDVVLLPGGEATASELVARYGDAVVVTVGELAQPSG